MYGKILLTLGFSIMFLVGCTSSGIGEAEEEQAVFVETSEVIVGDIENYNEIVGNVRPSSSVDVFAKTPGNVDEIFFDVGDEVKKGDVLFKLDETDVSFQVEQARTGLLLAKSNLERARGGSVSLQLSQLESSLRVAELNLRDAKTSYESTLELYQKSAVPRDIYQSAQTRYKSALEQYEGAKTSLELTQNSINKENLEAAKVQVEQARVGYDMALNTLKDMTITSPIDGVVSMKNIEKGALVSNAAPAFNIVDISKVYVDIGVLENVYTNIDVGDEFNVVIESIGAKEFDAKVVNVSPNIDPRTNTYMIRLSLDNEDMRLRGGMLARVRVITDRKEDVYMIPIDAIMQEAGDSIIYVVEQGRAKRKSIEVGIFDEELVEVKGDLSQGDLVVVRGQNFLEDDVKVEVR